jgi:hypothetical protein
MTGAALLAAGLLIAQGPQSNAQEKAKRSDPESASQPGSSAATPHMHAEQIGGEPGSGAQCGSGATQDMERKIRPHPIELIAQDGGDKSDHWRARGVDAGMPRSS